MPDLLSSYLNAYNEEGIEPCPNSTLLNDSVNIKFSITPGKTYRLRVISMASFVAHYVEIDGHEMTVIAVDSVSVNPTNASSIYVAVAQRYDILFTAKSDATQNYFFISSIDQTMIGGEFSITNPNAYGYLVYNSSGSLPDTYQPSFDPIDDFGLVPLDNQAILSPVSQTITLNMIFDNDDYGINRATINNQTYVPQVVPTLYTALSAPASDVMNPDIYGAGSNPFVVSYGDM
jgi:iron transport multicopper oxidase